MPKVSQMQGVPAHLETLKSDGKRRYISRCIHSIHKGNHKYECTCKYSAYNDQLCRSSKNCDYYEER